MNLPKAIQFPHILGKILYIVFQIQSYDPIFMIHLIQPMSKLCQDNRQISVFCKQPDCQSPVAGGCSTCFIENHTHTTSEKISLKDLKQLMHMYKFPNSLKPECNKIQQAVMKYFKNSGKKLTNFMNEICREIVNGIGFPLLTSKDQFSIYKKITKKNYNNITVKEVQQFTHETQSLDPSKINQQEHELYLEHVKKYYQIIVKIDTMLRELMADLHQRIGRGHELPKTDDIHSIHHLIHKLEIETGKKITEPALTQGRKISQVKHPTPNISPKTSYLSAQKGSTASTTQANAKKNVRSPEFASNTCSSELKQPTLNRRSRRSSIDEHIISENRKLFEKIASFSKQAKSEKKDEIEASEGQCINHHLPEGKSKQKVAAPSGEIELFPVKCKVQQTSSPMDESISPLIQEKKNTKGVKSENTQPRRAYQAKQHASLSENEQNSLGLLAASIKLSANEAIDHLERSLQECQNNISAGEYLSYLYLESNQPKKCLDLCNKFMHLLSNRSDLSEFSFIFVCNKSGALNLLGRYSETVTLLKSHNLNNDIAVKNLANAYFSLGKYELAIEQYQKVAKACHEPESYYNLSACWFMKQEYKKAMQSLEPALSSEPNNPTFLELQTNIRYRVSNESPINNEYRKRRSEKI